MKISKIIEPLQYTYSKSFRDIYDQNQRNRIQNSHKLVLQYEKIQTKSAPKVINKKNIKSLKDKNQNLTQSQFIKNFKNKYSFSIFVKRSREKQKKAYSILNQLQNNGLHQQKNHNKVKYSPFQNKQQNVQNSQIISQHMQKQKINSYKYSNSPDIAQEEYPQHFQTDYKDRRQIKSQRFTRKLFQFQKSKKLKNKINFSKTMKTFSFCQDGQPNSNKTKADNSFYSPKGYFGSSMVVRCRKNYPRNQNEQNSFLKIQKFNLQKRDQHFMKNCVDFQQIIVKDRKQKQKRIQLIETIKKSMIQDKNRTNIAVLRENKKRKKNYFGQISIDMTKDKDQIKPW